MYELWGSSGYMAAVWGTCSCTQWSWTYGAARVDEYSVLLRLLFIRTLQDVHSGDCQGLLGFVIGQPDGIGWQARLQHLGRSSCF